MKTVRVLFLLVVVVAISATAEAHEVPVCNALAKCWNCITKTGKKDCNCDCDRITCAKGIHPCYHCHKNGKGKNECDCDCGHIECDKHHPCYHCHSCFDCHCDCTHSPQ
nr:CP20k-like protein 2 [Capitulum mitella]